MTYNFTLLQHVKDGCCGLCFKDTCHLVYFVGLFKINNPVVVCYFDLFLKVTPVNLNIYTRGTLSSVSILYYEHICLNTFYATYIYIKYLNNLFSYDSSIRKN